MDGKQLDTVEEEKDLGIIIIKDLKVSQQCKQAYAKASRMLGLINRSIKNKDRDILLSLYKSLETTPGILYIGMVTSLLER